MTQEREEIINNVCIGKITWIEGMDALEETMNGQELTALNSGRNIHYSDSVIQRSTRNIYEVVEWLAENHGDNDAMYFFLMMANHGHDSTGNGEYEIEW